MDRGTLKGQAVGLGMLALNLSNELGRRVIDKTGLNGKYDFELKWTPVQASAPSLTSPPQTPEPALAAKPGPSIFTALQEQLGLCLESEKGPVEVLVVDRAERPSKNCHRNPSQAQRTLLMPCRSAPVIDRLESAHCKYRTPLLL